MNVLRLLVSVEVKVVVPQISLNEMTCGLKQGDEAFCLPNCHHEKMVGPVLTVSS